VITADRARELDGKRVRLELIPASGEREVIGTCLGHVEAADGVVLIVRREDQPARRSSYHYQHVTAAHDL